MTLHQLSRRTALHTILAACLLASLAGCHAIDLYTPAMQDPVPPAMEPPRELSKVSLPTYRIEPPDILRVEVLKLVPLPPYRIDIYDVLEIRVLGTLLDQPINDLYLVEGEGIVSLGPAYGTVRVAGMTIEEATAQIKRNLQQILRQPDVSVRLTRSEGTQQITNKYPVQPDGVINLGRYGTVHVAGKTVTEARMAVERQLALYFDSPQVSVDVIGYNSKSYYVIIGAKELSGGLVENYYYEQQYLLDWERSWQRRIEQTWLVRSENGAEISRTLANESTQDWTHEQWKEESNEYLSLSSRRVPFMIRGNETVLDAISDISQIQHLPPMSKNTIWVARPAPNGMGCEQILPVDWEAITRGGSTATNYQLMPGDRIYIMDDGLVAFNNFVFKITAPIEKLLGVTALGTTTMRGLQTFGRSYR